MIPIRARFLALLLCSQLCVAPWALAQTQSSFSQSRLDDSDECVDFVDSLLNRQIEEFRIPGLAFVLVKDGRVLMLKGHGYANLERSILVDPERTVFRAASVSKVVTATAVMQLVERGLLKTGEPVNNQLKTFQIAEQFQPPITLENLLTHTAGFDQSAIARRSRSALGVDSLASYLASGMPAQVFPPGEVMSYSNHGMALAGYLVEEDSGVPFESYMDENIFQPLGMTRSSYSLPQSLAGELAMGYKHEGDGYLPFGFDYIRTVPSSMLVTTADDMGRFITMQLQQGRYQDAVLLEEETLREMHRQHFTHHPGLDGIAYAYMERNYNNQRILWHDGNTGGFSSLLVLVPEQDLGFFVAYNVESTSAAREFLITRFFDQYFPAPVVPPPVPMTQSRPQLARKLAGHYRTTRYAHNSMEKLAVLLGPVDDVTVTSNPDGSVNLGGDRFVEVAPLLFQREDGRGSIAFREDARGRPSYLFAGTGTAWAFERVVWFESRSFHLYLCITAILVSLSVMLGRLLLKIRCWRKGQGLHRPDLARYAWRCACAVSGLNLLFLTGLVTAVSRYGDDLEYEMPGILVALLLLPLVIFVLNISLIGMTLAALLRRCGSFAGRLGLSLATLNGLAFLWFLHHWNLLTFTF